MDPKQATLMQMRIRNNAGDLQDYMKGLESWEEEIKKKDTSLSKQKPILKEALPPVRGSQSVKKTNRKKDNPVKVESQSRPRIKSYDFKAWDKFDIEKACEEVDYQVDSASSLSDEEDEEMERRQHAVLQKENGNELFKQGQYDLAVESYTLAVELDPQSAIMPANRAMALLKLEKYAAAERDCSSSLALDDRYLKAYLRRATARLKLGKTEEARKDLDAVLRLEPRNKLAKTELAKLNKERDKKFVLPVKRSPHIRSKLPLKCIAIEEIGQESPSEALDITSESKSTTPRTLLTAPVEKSASQEMVESSSSKTPNKPDTDIGSSTKIQPLIDPVDSISVTVLDVDRSKANQTDTGRKSETIKTTSSNLSTKMTVLSTETSQLPSTSDIKQTNVDKMSPLVKPTPLTLPPVPDNSISLQADWKRLRKDKKLLGEYFKNLPTSKYSTLLWQSLETDVFSDIVSILLDKYVRCGLGCLKELEALTKVNRFTVAVMFLSRKDKELLKQLFTILRQLFEHEGDMERILKLQKSFGV